MVATHIAANASLISNTSTSEADRPARARALGIARTGASPVSEQHRDELPMSDQLPTLDPPAHTAHRALLMRLITPKRLKENEASMWTLADRLLEEFLAPGEGEFISGFAGPFTLLVIADLLGVPEANHREFARALQQRPRSDGIGSTGEGTPTHSPLEFLYGRFTVLRRGPPPCSSG